ncbi:hypothetical protein [Halorussus sp. MSC15.2]|uniref:hypothetical protein n=1 Tax=Halorussus sp. MSC15.2 TaxID=2283638 RepID=UPI0013D6FC8D|nr:hypothetical protein [Halorussus sp. MSC15.2]NEU58638.1 hypothetical protein [Halorussus sp. MSC15.2]
MNGPNSASGTFGPRSTETNDWPWASGDSDSRHTECELCQSNTTTSMEYGMRVCRTCERKYLP